MNIKKYFNKIEFVGDVQSKKKRYSVYQNSNYFLVIAGKPPYGTEGNYNVVNKSDVYRIHRKFAGKNALTMNEIKSKVSIGKNKNNMAIYNVIYAIIAIGLANIDKRYKATRALHINFYKR